MLATNPMPGRPSINTALVKSGFSYILTLQVMIEVPLGWDNREGLSL
jgi:hypothetical protein